LEGFGRPTVNEFRAQFDGDIRRRVVERPNAPADAIARFEYGDVETSFYERTSRR
jgi:hypothetical protein